MSLQIRIAQAPEDEQELIENLLKKFDLLCLPRIMKSKNVKPERLGQSEEKYQVFFLTDTLKITFRNIKPVKGEKDKYHVFANGLCIEWDRTATVGKGFVEGRFYYQTSEPVSETTDAVLKKVMAYITRTIKKTYPLIVPYRHPIYVGPHLGKLIRQKRVFVAAPNGVQISTQPNPLFTK